MKECLNIYGDGKLNPLPPFFLVPGQPLNFKAEPESETSILLSWTPPRSDTIASYELVYKDGEHGEEVGLLLRFGVSHCPGSQLCFCVLVQLLLQGQISIEDLGRKDLFIQ